MIQVQYGLKVDGVKKKKKKKKMNSYCEKAQVPTWEVDLIEYTTVVNEEVVLKKRSWEQVGGRSEGWHAFAGSITYG